RMASYVTLALRRANRTNTAPITATTIEPMIPPPTPRSSRSLKIQPPRIAPTTPTIIVPINPPGVRPGTRYPAIAPATSPIINDHRVSIGLLLQLVSQGGSQQRQAAPG